MQHLLTRIFSGVVFIFIFILAIFFSEKSYVALLMFFGVVATYEFSKLIQFKNIIPYFLQLLVPIYFISYGSKKLLLFFLIITLICSVQLIYNLFTHTKKQPASFLSKLDLSVRYIVLPFSFLITLPFIKNEYQPYFIIHLLVLVWVNDSFAFLVGKNLGKHKLFETISPKKTIEGFVGGLLFSLITCFFIAKYNSNFSILNWCIIALILSVLGTIGDLVESKFKRQANVKDSGKIMPGHGGVLDRLDSLFFATPFVYLYIHYLV